MSEAIIKKNGTDYPLLTMPNHYPADRVYLDGDTTKTVQDKCARKADLTNLDLTGTTNTTGSTISSGTYFYLNGTLVRAKTAIANGATFTLNTNYEAVTAGGLNDLNSTINDKTKIRKKYKFPQTTSSHTLTFSGTCYTRAKAGELTITGQSGISRTVNLYFGGTGAYEAISGVGISDTLDNALTISGKTINIYQALFGGWGNIEVELYSNDLTCTIS